MIGTELKTRGSEIQNCIAISMTFPNTNRDSNLLKSFINHLFRKKYFPKDLYIHIYISPKFLMLCAHHIFLNKYDIDGFHISSTIYLHTYIYATQKYRAFMQIIKINTTSNITVLRYLIFAQIKSLL